MTPAERDDVERSLLDLAIAFDVALWAAIAGILTLVVLSA